MDDDTLLPFDLPAVARKRVTAAFDGGRLSSDGGVLLLRGVERRLGLAERLAGCIVDRRDASRIDREIVAGRGNGRRFCFVRLTTLRPRAAAAPRC